MKAWALLLGTVLTFGAAEQTWTGKISDSICRAKHELGEGIETPPDPECTIVCIRGGSKYILSVSDEKFYQIANQDNADLPKNAGRFVKITGELKGDSITVTKIEVVPEQK